MREGSLYILAGALSPLVEWGDWLPYSLLYVNLTEYLMAWLTFPSNMSSAIALAIFNVSSSRFNASCLVKILGLPVCITW